MKPASLIHCLLLVLALTLAPGVARPTLAQSDATPPTPAAATSPTPAAPAPTPDVVKVSVSHGYRIAPPASPRNATIGSVDPASGFAMETRLTRWGAGVARIALAKYHTSFYNHDPYIVLSGLKAGEQYIYHLAARAVVINGQRVELMAEEWSLAASDESSAQYVLTIVDAQGQPVLDIHRTFSLAKDSFELSCRQKLVNRTDSPLNVVWEQNAQGDISGDDAAYMGDRREFTAGYFNPGYDPTRTFIYIDDASTDRLSVLNHFAETAQPFWPTKGVPKDAELVWLASKNRYFAAVTHLAVNTAAPAGAQAVVALQQAYETPALQVIGAPAYNDSPDSRQLMLTLASRPLSITPRQAADLDVFLFAGPRDKSLFAQAPYAQLALGKLIIYNLGGPCAFCTFQPLAKGLLWFLELLHTITRDWGVAIIILVLVVRLLLHPITRKAQINMAKFSKQMASLQPEIEKLKKKFGDDNQKLQSETMKLYREKGINPANMLGCLPMFLQMPIWIALYAMLYFAIELRHQDAFYGLFQAISGGSWGFLGDLSSPDYFVRFAGEGIKLNLLFIHPHFAGINIIPLLMAGLFFLQQKFTTPPPANEQAAQQQKIMMFTTLLFPIFLYSAPSGLTLYIMASTSAGIVDSYIVKRHIKREEEAGTLFQPAAPSKPGGLMARIQKLIEEKQNKAAQSHKYNKKP